MSTNVIQTSFASGELSPSLFARVDLTKYHSGAARMRNFFVDYRSGCSTRPGTKFVIQALKSSTAVRVIPFQTSVLVPYVLEFGDFYARPITMGAPVLESAFAIASATQANPVVLSVPGNPFLPGDWVYVYNVVGMLQLGNRYFSVQAVSGNNVTLADVNGVAIDGRAYSAFTSGTIARVYKFTSPYAAADLALVKFVQVGNTMYMVHPAYAPQILTFTSPTNWSFAAVTFGTTAATPTGLAGTSSAAGVANYSYEITSTDANGQESTPSAAAAVLNAVNIGATAGTISLTWNAAAGAAGYNVYKAELSISSAVPSGAAYGFIGSATGLAFKDSNIVPDFAQTPPIATNPFASGNNPGAICFFQQRLYYAASTNFPQTFWGSQPGFYNNFNVSDPVVDDDALTATLVSLQVNYIKSMVPMPGGLVLFTATGAWQVSSGTGLGSTTAVTPINATATPQSYNGASDVPPVPIDQAILYVRPTAVVIELAYSINANMYAGQDISILSNHLFFGYQIREWAWAQDPFKIIWAVRNDGVCLSLTYVKEQEIFGWARHDTLGQFKSVATVVEGVNNAVYFVVKRFIGGRWVQMIERMADRTFPYGAEDAWCVDCGSQSGSTSPAADLTIAATSGSSAAYTASAAVFNSGSVGSIIRAGGGIAEVVTFVSPTQVLCNITQEVSIVIPNPSGDDFPAPVDSGNWTIAAQFSTFYGLDYLEGQTVSILADGNVITPQVVSGGSITLNQPASKVTVGLPFQPQLQTMYLDLGNEKDTIQGKRKKLNGLTLRLRETRGLSFGRTFNLLTPVKEFSQGMSLGQTIPLVTADEYVIMDPLWDVPGQICIQQDNPLPATVLGVVPEITLGDDAR